MGWNMRYLLLYLALCCWALTGSAYSAPFLLDNFSTVSNTALVSHSPDTGGTWTSASGTVYTTGLLAGVVGNPYNIATSTSQNYTVTATVATKSTIGGPGPCARVQTDLSGYCAYVYGNGNFYLTRRASGGEFSANISGPVAVADYTKDTTYTIALTVNGNSISATAYEGATLKATLIGTDSTHSSGYAGIMSTVSNSYIYDVTAEDISIVTYTTHTVQAAELLDNGYDNVAAPRQSTFSRFRFSTNSDTVKIVGTTSIYGEYPSWANLGVVVDGINQSKLPFTSNGAAEFTVALPGASGTTRDVQIISGLETKPSATVLGTFIDSVAYEDGSSFSVQSGSATGRVLIYGDSIASGASSTTPEYQGYATLLRSSYNKNVMLESWGYRSLYDDANTAGLRSAFVSRVSGYEPNTIMLAVGTNDYGLNKWSAVSFGAAYAATVDALHTALPGTSIICQTPLVRATETANGSGSTTDDYRSQIISICQARGWLRCIDGKKILNLVDLVDGVHPSTAGHSKYAEYINGYLSATGSAALLMVQ